MHVSEILSWTHEHVELYLEVARAGLGLKSSIQIEEKLSKIYAYSMLIHHPQSWFMKHHIYRFKSLQKKMSNK